MPTKAAASFFYFDPAHLTRIAEARAQEYQHAEPFPHVVIDNFLPEDVIDECLGEFPKPQDVPWTEYTDAGNTKKLAVQEETLMGPFTRHLLSQLNASTFMQFLETLTGISGLVGDPHLLGGGLHQIEAGGFLNIHADFNRHPTLRLDRKLNLLLYLNRNWKDEYGGDLQLWSRDMSHCERRVFPVANRCVIFSTTDTSFHGHPEPLTTPPGVTRKSLALYYYAAVMDQEASPDHSTLYQARGGDDDGARQWREQVRRFVPPIAVDGVHRVRARLGRRSG